MPLLDLLHLLADVVLNHRLPLPLGLELLLGLLVGNDSRGQLRLSVVFPELRVRLVRLMKSDSGRRLRRTFRKPGYLLLQCELPLLL